MKRFPLLLLLFVVAFPARAQVRVWQGTLDLPTYEEGAPDRNPPFDQFATTRFNYPYTLRTNLTGKRADHQWRAIFLENEYLKCSVLPDLGGHLYTCIDKISGQPMFYANPSIKKANIGYRGAWAAFGIEFNFPVSHNWMSLSPVDFSYGANKDGSATVTVGNVDRVYGMDWSVALTLRPGSTLLEEHVVLNNRSDVRHRFYWWNNAGVQVWDDSHLEYPMRFAAAHGFAEIQPWPVDPSGKDLSVIRNQTDGPVSLFVHGSREEFMGVWNPRTNTGTIHFADYSELPAKKVWSWGVDPDGLDWRKALSDNDSAYVELQAGLFRNQETYAFLQPRQTIAFDEYWMPMRGTGGVSRANLAGVVRLSRENGSLVVAFNANRRIPGASIRVLDGSHVLLDEKVDLDPAQLYKKQLQLTDPAQKCVFELKDGAGNILLSHTEGKFDWTPASEIKVGPQPRFPMPLEAKRTEDDWLHFGEDAELNGNLPEALHAYEKALARFPSSYDLQKAAGRLYAGLYRFADGEKLLSAVHNRNTTDGEVSYYLGICKEGLGHDGDAIPHFESALRLPSFRAEAALKLAEIHARQGQLAEAERFARDAVRVAGGDARAAEELEAILRAENRASEAGSLAAESLSRFPLSDFLREELGQPSLEHLAADPYRVLNLAREYARLGLYQRAVDVLARNYPSVNSDRSEPGTVLPQNHPLVAYFRGYCREKLGLSGKADFDQAALLSTLYVFPSTVEDWRSLRAALRANPEDANAHALLGTWLFARGETYSALAEWAEARKRKPELPALQANIGSALLRVKGQPGEALDAFQSGIRDDPTNTVNYLGALTATAILKQPPSSRVKILESYPDPEHMPVDMAYELALNRAEAGQFQQAAGVFHNRFFGREEGGTNVRQVWVEVSLQRALALSGQGQCGQAISAIRSLGAAVPGLAFTNDGLQAELAKPRTRYLSGQVFERCGKKGEAAQQFRGAAGSSDPAQLVWQWAAARRLGNAGAAPWRRRFESAIAALDARMDSSGYAGRLLCAKGILQLALGRQAAGEQSLRGALLAPDSLMSHHFARLALAGATPR